MMKSSKKCDVPTLNIQSYIRVRPLTEKEKRTHVLEFTRREVVLRNAAAKTLTFDRVFEEDSKQIVVYNTIVHPMIKEVIQGYNCTVFAYGQTGTGKTYTMTGYQGGPDGSLVDNLHAGIIPRAMDEIFKELLMVGSEYQVAVQYIELYNEKLRNLLTDGPEDSGIQLIDDPEGGVLIRGVPPTPVKNKDDALKLLLQGAERKQMASTFMNENSSRSHTIFVIIINIKESVVGGKEDILRVGKLYLVDLAGSENVTKSGANDTSLKNNTKRLAEASNINKSLLTLGRVITSLTENQSHIPYRESKLTRLLRDSLGGRTKTCIIGTISPAQANIDETESTLNYAFKARSIKNNPQKNQKISKKEFMQLASEEILKLKRDLEAVRQGDGFYISKESHEEMCSHMKGLENQVHDWNDRFNKLSTSFEEKRQMFESLNMDYDEKCAEYQELEQVFNEESKRLKEKINEFQKEINIREYLITEFEKTEQNLTEQAKVCKSVLETLADQSGALHDKIDRKSNIEKHNVQGLDDFKNRVSEKLKFQNDEMKKIFVEENNFVKDFSKFAGNTVDMLNGEIKEFISKLNCFEKMVAEQFKEWEEVQQDGAEDVQRKLQDHESLLKVRSESHQQFIRSFLSDSIQPFFEQILLKHRDMQTALQNECLRIKEFSSKSLKLEQDAADISKKWEMTTSTIINEISVLRRNIEESQQSSRKTLQNDEMSKKLADLMTTCAELSKLNEQRNSFAAQTDNGLQSSLQCTVQLESLVSEEMKTLHTAEMANVTQLFKLREENNELLEQIPLQLNPQLEHLSDESTKMIKVLEESTTEKLSELKKHSKSEEKSLQILSDKINHLTSTVNKKMQKSQKCTNKFVLDITKQLNNSEESHTALFRKHLDEVFCHSNSISRKEQEVEKTMKEMRNELHSFRYSSDIPLGSTPQRFTKNHLSYPKEFLATAPRNILIQRFYEEEVKVSSKCEPTSESSVDHDSQSNSLDEVSSSLPLKPCENTVQFRTPKNLKKTKLRRSRSDSHLMTMSPSSQDKENVGLAQTSKKKKRTIVKRKAINH